jgi:hypothetical protein
MAGFLIVAGVFAVLAAVGARGSAASTAPASPAAAELRASLRKLWEDHITYTRNFIVSAIANLPDQEAVRQRLLKNQDDLGAAIKPYYGPAAGDQLAALLRDHILIAVDVVHAAVSGNQGAVQMQQQRWSRNGRDIAALLSSVNPNLPRELLEQMLQKHLDLTTKEAVSRLHGDWASDIAAYDEGHEHMLMFSDALADGIAKHLVGGSRGTYRQYGT